MTRQRTLKSPIEYSGVGLHTGVMGKARVVPAPAGTGLRFVRVDCEGRPEVPVIPGNATYDADQGRRTILRASGVEVHTVEHLLAALAGLGVDNARIELDCMEVPEPRDGSARPIVQLLLEAGLVSQDAEREPHRVAGPVEYRDGNVHLLAVPHDGFRISFTIQYDDAFVRTQHASYEIDPEVFAREIAPARTFVLQRDVEQLRAQGLIRGGSPDNGVVVKETGIESTEPLRFPDEFVRHKILDLIGDLSLLGRPLQGHVLAFRSGHQSNVAFVQKLVEQPLNPSRNGASDHPGRKPVYDIREILELMPHRFPFLLVDRILELEPGRRVVGIKNVTINEPFFPGHFPGHPVMPGVLIIEAMAQCGGFLLLQTMAESRNKLVYFMAIEGAKFRHPVTPGDTLRLEVEMLKLKPRMCKVRGRAFVEGQLVAEADLLSGIVDR